MPLPHARRRMLPARAPTPRLPLSVTRPAPFRSALSNAQPSWSVCARSPFSPACPQPIHMEDDDAVRQVQQALNLKGAHAHTICAFLLRHCDGNIAAAINAVIADRGTPSTSSAGASSCGSAHEDHASGMRTRRSSRVVPSSSSLGKRPIATAEDGAGVANIPLDCNERKRPVPAVTELGDELDESARGPTPSDAPLQDTLATCTDVRALPEAFWHQLRGQTENENLEVVGQRCSAPSSFGDLFDVLIDPTTGWRRAQYLRPLAAPTEGGAEGERRHEDEQPEGMADETMSIEFEGSDGTVEDAVGTSIAPCRVYDHEGGPELGERVQCSHQELEATVNAFVEQGYMAEAHATRLLAAARADSERLAAMRPVSWRVSRYLFEAVHLKFTWPAEVAGQTFRMVTSHHEHFLSYTFEHVDDRVPRPVRPDVPYPEHPIYQGIHRDHPDYEAEVEVYHAQERIYNDAQRLYMEEMNEYERRSVLSREVKESLELNQLELPRCLVTLRASAASQTISAARRRACPFRSLHLCACCVLCRAALYPHDRRAFRLL